MPRIIVTTDSPRTSLETPVLLDESVNSVHLSTGHAAAQLIERLAWAIGDAESAEAADVPSKPASRPAPRRRGATSGRLSPATRR